MKLHANAALSRSGRRRLVERVVVEGWSLRAAAAAAGISTRCACKRVRRYRLEGEGGLVDRSSAPRRVWNRTPAQRVQAILALRQLRFTAAEIAELLGMALSTVSAILLRNGRGKLGRLGLEPARRYEYARPGELVHIDVKKLGRIEGGAGKRTRGGKRQHYNPTYTDRAGRRRRTVGWEFVHVAVDDHSRLAYAEVLADERAATAIGFLRRARAHYARYGIRVERVMTDNGAAYRAAVHALACRALGIAHLRTRPHRPQTNGKAERFIRTLLAGWAYGAVYGSSAERVGALDGWLWHYNHRRRHSALGNQPPVARAREPTCSVATSCAAVTTRLITSKDIKNGTIQPVDLSAGTKATLRGFRSVEMIKSPYTELHIGSTGTATAYCPPRSVLVGGGYQAGDKSIVYSSHPSGESWQVTGKYTGSIFFDALYAYTLCAH